MTEPEFWDEARAREEPVETGCCLWCKSETVPDERTLLKTGEVLCDACLGDAREWGRTERVQLYVWRGLEPAVRRVVISHWRDAAEELDDLYEAHEDLFVLPTVKSNAIERERTHVDTE